MQANRDQRPIEAKELWPDDICKAIQLQSLVGTRAFTEGLLHCQWEEIQSQYLKSINSRRSPRRWMRLLILKTWMVSWDIWDARNGIVHNHQETRLQQIGAALDRDITDLHNTGRNHRFLPRVAQQFFNTTLENILTKTDYQKRVWCRLANRYLANDQRRMQSNPAAARMREWLMSGSTGRGQLTQQGRTNNRS